MVERKAAYCSYDSTIIAQLDRLEEVRTAVANLVLSGSGEGDSLRALYEETGVFAKADRLVQLYRDRARALADEAEPPAIGELMRFIVETIL